MSVTGLLCCGETVRASGSQHDVSPRILKQLMQPNGSRCCHGVEQELAVDTLIPKHVDVRSLQSLSNLCLTHAGRLV